MWHANASTELVRKFKRVEVAGDNSGSNYSGKIYQNLPDFALKPSHPELTKVSIYVLRFVTDACIPVL